MLEGPLIYMIGRKFGSPPSSQDSVEIKTNLKFTGIFIEFI